jgi:CubicO group peptidase (beta-lactamase class C family)
MRQAPFVLAALLVASFAHGQTTLPDTPAGKTLAAWLEAFNSADIAKMEAFDEAHGGNPPLAKQARFRQLTGGFTLLRVEKSEPMSVTALIQEKDSDTVARYELTVAEGEPAKIASSSLRAIPRPPDLAIPRMSEAEALSALVARADEAAEKDQFSGAVLIARNGKTLLEKAWGQADRDAGIPNTLDTQFRLGSMNKMFTAVGTLQLVDAGKLSLDDTVGKVLPDYPNPDIAAKVTIRHLLTHTGGTGDIFGQEFRDHRLELREHSDYVKLFGERGLTHEPGAEHRYSNYGFVLLGAIIEKTSGMSYYDYVRTKIFEPAGMKSTDSLPESEKVAKRSFGYMRGADGWTSNADTLPWRGTAAGGGYSTVGDLLRFAQALQSGKLVSKQFLAQATTPQAQSYGFGFGIFGEGALLRYGHGGGAPGMNGDLRVYPELGYVVIALSNLDPPAAQRLADYFTLRMPEAP